MGDCKACILPFALNMPRPSLQLSTTPFGTGRQTVGSAGAEIWDETLKKEAMHQQRDCHKMMPQRNPPNTKIPLQIRDTSFIVPGDPRLRPKIYLGHKSAPLFCGHETCAPHTPS